MTSRPAAQALGLDRPLSRVSVAALVLGLAALWLLGRRYTGLTHDASVYLVQALRRLDPGAFSADLFFRFGSQDAYTLFPWLYAPLVGALGAGTAALIVTMLGQGLLLGAAALFVRRFAPGRESWWALVLLAAMSGYYGGVGVFRIAETFATARVLAEPLVVAALAAQLGGRSLPAAVLAALATLLHPLVAAPGVAVLLGVAVAPRDPWRAARWLGALFIGAMAVAAAVPLPRMDPEWVAVLKERSPHLFVLAWPGVDWARVGWSFLVTAVALCSLVGPARRLVAGVAAVAALGLAASALAVDGLGVAAAAAAQPWRAVWLLQFLAIVLVPVAVAGCWREGPAGRGAALFLAASCGFSREDLGWACGLAALACGLAVIARHRALWIGPRALRGLALAACCAGAVGLLFDVQARLPQPYGALHSLGGTDPWALAGSLAALLVIAGVLYVAAHVRPAVALAASAAALVAALAAWDARRPWPRFLEHAQEDLVDLRRHLPPDAQVYWPGPYSRVWLGLRVPAWFSVDQGAGVVFHRETALAYRERLDATRDLVAAAENCNYAGPSCRIEARLVDALCARADGPDFLVLGAPTDRPLLAGRELPPTLGPSRQQALLYRCK